MSTDSKPKVKKTAKTKKDARTWSIEEALKKWKKASTIPYLTNRLKSLQMTRMRLVRAGEIDKAVVIQQGIQKLQVRIERLKRDKNPRS